MKSFAVALCAAALALASAQNTPDPKNARAPYPAIQPGGENPVTYSIGESAASSSQSDAALHEKTVDGKVVIHPGDQTGYNATGEGNEDGCCRICPKRKDCADNGEDRCFSDCFQKCGAECDIPNNAPKCVIGVDCGMVAGNESAVSQDSSSSVVVSGSGIHDKDMKEGSEEMKSEKSDNTPDAPIAGQERPPLAATNAGNGGGELTNSEAPSNLVVPGEVAPVPAAPATLPAPKITVNVASGGEGAPKVDVESAPPAAEAAPAAADASTAAAPAAAAASTAAPPVAEAAPAAAADTASAARFAAAPPKKPRKLRAKPRKLFAKPRK